MPTLTDRELEELKDLLAVAKDNWNTFVSVNAVTFERLLSSYEERGKALEPFAKAWKLAAEQCPRNTLGAVKAVANYHTEASHYQQAARSLSPSGGGE